MTTLTAAQSAVVEAALAALTSNPSPKETITVNPVNTPAETVVTVAASTETVASVAAAALASAPVVAVVVPKPVKAPWKCSDCTTLIHPTGKRGRPAVRCDSCKAKVLQDKADAAAKAVAANVEAAKVAASTVVPAAAVAAAPAV